ncbi:MAG: hypothetical protein MHPSP_004640, partial [Paramarteilia canceri]
MAQYFPPSPIPPQQSAPSTIQTQECPPAPTMAQYFPPSPIPPQQSAPSTTQFQECPPAPVSAQFYPLPTSNQGYPSAQTFDQQFLPVYDTQGEQNICSMISDYPMEYGNEANLDGNDQSFKMKELKDLLKEMISEMLNLKRHLTSSKYKENYSLKSNYKYKGSKSRSVTKSSSPYKSKSRHASRSQEKSKRKPSEKRYKQDRYDEYEEEERKNIPN